MLSEQGLEPSQLHLLPEPVFSVPFSCLPSLEPENSEGLSSLVSEALAYGSPLKNQSNSPT